MFGLGLVPAWSFPLRQPLYLDAVQKKGAVTLNLSSVAAWRLFRITVTFFMVTTALEPASTKPARMASNLECPAAHLPSRAMVFFAAVHDRCRCSPGLTKVGTG
jgi:hypothetical protein